MEMLERKALEVLYDESERRGCFGLCPLCEDQSFEDGTPAEEHVICYICGVCFKYHHQAWCESVADLPDVP